MKHWLMLQDYTAFNTMYRKTPQKQTTFVSPIGNEKQIDYILTKRRYLRHNKDAEANDNDPHWERPQMCHGYFDDHRAWKEQPLQEY